jgi:hypothetical protein
VAGRLAGRVGHGVGQPVGDGTQAGGVGVAQAGDLHRRRPAGEHAQAVARVPAQVHQQVDAVRPHLPGDVRIREEKVREEVESRGGAVV